MGDLRTRRFPGTRLKRVRMRMHKIRILFFLLVAAFCAADNWETILPESETFAEAYESDNVDGESLLQHIETHEKSPKDTTDSLNKIASAVEIAMDKLNTNKPRKKMPHLAKAAKKAAKKAVKKAAKKAAKKKAKKGSSSSAQASEEAHEEAHEEAVGDG